MCTVHSADGWPRARCGNRSLDVTKWNRGYACYVGTRTLKALSKCTTFVRVTQQINEVYGRSV